MCAWIRRTRCSQENKNWKHGLFFLKKKHTSTSDQQNFECIVFVRLQYSSSNALKILLIRGGRHLEKKRSKMTPPGSQTLENRLQALRLCNFQLPRTCCRAIPGWGKVAVARGKCGPGKVANVDLDEISACASKTATTESHTGDAQRFDYVPILTFLNFDSS